MTLLHGFVDTKLLENSIPLSKCATLSTGWLESQSYFFGADKNNKPSSLPIQLTAKED